MFSRSLGLYSFFLISPGFTGFFWVLLGFSSFYSDLLGLTVFYWVLMNFNHYFRFETNILLIFILFFAQRMNLRSKIRIGSIFFFQRALASVVFGKIRRLNS